MSKPGLERIKAIFAEAVEKIGAERQAFLRQACGDDAELLAEVQAFLSASERVGDFLESPTAEPSSKRAGSPQRSFLEGPGSVIGQYKLLQLIGEGGFGSVFMAEQERPVRRKVALKIIKLGMDTKQVIARFEAERQALAIMDHPNIAKVLEAGATETGRPYFVMELVRGVPITEYCDSQRLTTRQRAELFVQVCQAIQHAHQKGVIHRDIKPNNVLVTMHDDKAVPKVIDFGIAKATGQNLTEKTLFTEFRQFVGTPAYMSPEQAQMNELDVDTRSDIYSLGVLLYELLTGTTPFDPRQLRSAAYDEIRRIIREVEPPKPSTRISTLGDTLPGVAERRRIDPSQFSHSMKGELDWIVMKAMDKDRTRRYETANGLTLDIQRYLNDEPILARPPSSAYRFRKLVRRNKLAFGAAAAVSLALVLGVCLSTWEAVRASRARDIAQAARADEATQRHIAEDARRQADAREFAARQRAYASDIHLLQHAIETGDLGKAQNLLDRQLPQNGEQDLRGWEWRYLWQFCKSDALYTLCHEPNEIYSLSSSSDGKWLATGQFLDGAVAVWDLGTRQPIARLQVGNRQAFVLFAPRSRVLAVAGGTLSASTVRLWDGETRRFICEIPLQGGFAGMAFSDDGQILATCARNPANEFTFWQIPQGTKIKGYPATSLAPQWLLNAEFGRNLKVAIYSLEDHRSRMMDLSNGKELWTQRLTQDRLIYKLSFSPDGKTFACCSAVTDPTIQIRDVDSGRLTGTLVGHTGYVHDLAFSADGKTLVSGSTDQTVRVWDVAQRRLLATLRGHHNEVRSVAFGTDQKLIFSGCKDGTIMAWNPATVEPKSAGYVLPTPGGSDQWMFMQDNSLLVRDGSGRFGLWKGPDYDEASPLMNREFPNSYARTRFAQVSEDNALMAIGSADGHVEVWDLQKPSKPKLIVASTQPAQPLCFDSHDKRLLVVRWAEDTIIQEWDLDTLRPTRSWSIPRNVEHRFYITPDEITLLDVTDETGQAVSMNLSTNAQTRWDIGAKQVYDIEFSADGSLMAASSNLGLVKLWDMTGHRELATLTDFSRAVHFAAFSPDNKRLVTGSSGDRPIAIWDIASHEDLLRLDTLGNEFNAISFSPDGNVLAAETAEGALHIWRAPSWSEIEAAESRQASPIPPYPGN
jgi:WD40 repeat protein/serine/threonine protein kinase